MRSLIIYADWGASCVVEHHHSVVLKPKTELHAVFHKQTDDHMSA